MNQETYYTIYSQRLAGHLMVKGFVLIGMDKNKCQLDKNVFFFRDSVELQAAISAYIANYKTVEV